jgi:transposase
MLRTARIPHPTAAVQDYDTALFAALELSRSTWLLAVNVPDSDKIGKYRIDAGDSAALLKLLSRLRAEAERRCDRPVRTISIYEAGLDGFWIHRLLETNGVESHVVDAASIAVDRRHRRAKTDRIDVEMLLRTVMAWARGERRVCAMVRPPSPTQEDERRLTRERGTLVTERVRHVNRIKGLLATQGVLTMSPSVRIVASAWRNCTAGMMSRCPHG